MSNNLELTLSELGFLNVIEDDQSIIFQLPLTKVKMKYLKLTKTISTKEHVLEEEHELQYWMDLCRDLNLMHTIFTSI